MLREPLDYSYGSALEDRSGKAYNQPTFRHFLSIERKRVRRSGRLSSLLLVTLKAPDGTTADMSPMLASQIFSALGPSVRAVDFTGWYRYGRAVGAVLALGPNDLQQDVRTVISARVTEAMCRRLPADVFARVQVRVLQLPWRPKCTAA